MNPVRIRNVPMGRDGAMGSSPLYLRGKIHGNG